MEYKKILSVNNLDKYFVKSGKLVKILDDINFDVYEQDFFGIIGESGSGKSTTGKCIIRLYDTTSGIINFDDKIINQKNISKEDKKWLCKNMSMIFQDPMSSLNPKKTVLSLIAEPLYINKVIKNDIKNIIDISVKINHFFKNIFKWQDYNLNKKYLIPFYDESIKLFNDASKEIREYNINDNNSKNLCLNFLAKLIGYETRFKSLIPQIYEYNHLTKELVAFNYNKLESKSIKVEESNYYEALKLYKEQQKILYAPEKYWDLKKSRDELVKNLNDLIDKTNRIFQHDKNSFINATLNSLRAELKIYKRNKKITTSLSEYKIMNIKILMVQEVIDAFSKLDDLFIDGLELENLLNYINQKVQYKYTKTLKDAMQLKQIGEVIDKMNLSKNNKDDIINVLTSYKNLYFSIKNEIEFLNNTNKIIDDNDVNLLISRLFEESNCVKKEIKDKKERYKNSIKIINDEMTVLKKNYVGSIEYMTNKKKMEDISILLDKATNRKKAIDDLNDSSFNEKVLPGIIEQKKIIKERINQFKLAQKNYINELKQIRKKISSVIKANDGNDNYWIEFIKREISSKINNIYAINFEKDTYIDEVDIYHSIRTTNKQKINIYKKALRTIITRQYVYKALNDVGLKNEHAYRYPHEFSGGQRQRIVIARALIMKPKLIIADEPISALDVSIQAQVINIMKKLSEEMGITFLFIAHDLSMIRYVSNRLIIMHKGRIVEKGNTKEIFRNPIHPYTKSLIKASPELSKIHIDLASFNTNLDYDVDYGKSVNIPYFFSVNENIEHYVFGTKEQIERWKK